jgi:hypothetical protein
VGTTFIGGFIFPAHDFPLWILTIYLPIFSSPAFLPIGQNVTALPPCAALRAKTLLLRNKQFSKPIGSGVAQCRFPLFTNRRKAVRERAVPPSPA